MCCCCAQWLRQKGLAGADKKAGRVAAEGSIATYIHPGARLGVLFEVNCETDFVAAGEKFQALISELGMIIAASPDVMVVSPDDVPAEVLAKEREVEMGKEDIKSRPEAIRWEELPGAGGRECAAGGWGVWPLQTRGTSSVAEGEGSSGIGGRDRT